MNRVNEDFQRANTPIPEEMPSWVLQVATHAAHEANGVPKVFGLPYRALVGYIVAGVVALGGWHLSVRDSIGERPTVIETKEMLAPVVKKLDQHDAAIHEIQMSVGVMAKTQETIAEDITDIKDALRDFTNIGR